MLDAGGRVIKITPPRFFPEGVAVDKNGNFYVGSMELGAIYRATAKDAEAVPFIAPDTTNKLVSVIGLFADDAKNLLYVCSSDAGNSPQTGTAAAAIKAFSLADGAFVASYDWPAFSGTALPAEKTKGVTGFCNDMTMDASGNLYATDSWYPRILRLPAGGTALEEWVVSPVFPQDQWHLNGIDIDQSSDTLYVVENHPGALYTVPIMSGGKPGTVTQVTTSRALLSPDGLKVVAPNLLVTAEGGNDGGGVAYIRVPRAPAPRRHRHLRNAEPLHFHGVQSVRPLGRQGYLAASVQLHPTSSARPSSCCAFSGTGTGTGTFTGDQPI